MKLQTVDFAIDLLEFVDRFGLIRTIHGCSLLGLQEFDARLKALGKILEEADGRSTIASLYRNDRIFQHHCNRCLELNGVDPDWLDSKGQILEGLLFVHEEGLGLLVRLNAPDKPATVAKGSGEAASVYDIAAALLSMTNDLSKTLEELKTLPAKQVSNIIDARGRQLEKAEGKQEDKARKEWAAKMRSGPKTPLIN